MFTRADLGDLSHQQAPRPRLWFWSIFEHSPQKSTKQCARETGIIRTSVRRIIKTAKLKVFILRLLHAVNEDDSDRRMQYCEWFWNMVQEDEAFVGKVV